MVPTQIRPAKLHDLPPIVDLHMAAFPGFFLTFLGRRFLRMLYRQIIEREIGVLLVAEEDGQLRGLVGGVTRQSGFYRSLVRENLFGFAWASAGAVLRRPTIILRLLRALRRAGEANESASEACLMSLAVHPDSSGQGIGRRLVEAFCEELRRRNCPDICLTTDVEDNEAVNRFYRRLGFGIARRYSTSEGRLMYEYVRPLRNA